MNERGIFTIIGIGFLLLATICIKGIKDFGKIYALDTASFQIENELKNVSENALLEAYEIVKNNPEILPKFTLGLPSEFQKKILVSQPKNSERLENISVEVYGERGDIYQGRKIFNYGGKFTIKMDKNDEDKDLHFEGIVLMSVASCEEKIFGGKIYKKTFAYIPENEEKIYYIKSD